jgi:hypothetical protein
MRARMLAGDRRQMPGMVRVSVGLYNTKDEIDWLVEDLTRITAGDVKGKYTQDPAIGKSHPTEGHTAPAERSDFLF